MRTLLLSAFFLLVFLKPTFSQDTAKYEIGLRNIGFNNSAYIFSTPNFFLKYKVGENKYRRYTVALGHLSFQKIDSISQQVDNSFSFVFGTEKRVPIKSKVSLLRGWQYILGTSFNGSKRSANSIKNKATQFSPTVGVGYALGLIYEISPQFNFGVEAMPTAQVSAVFRNFQDKNDISYSFNANFNLSSVSIFGAYRF